MTTLAADLRCAVAVHVSMTDDSVVVDLSDGRTLSVPIAWFPRLVHATLAERGNWRRIGRGEGIHWPELDEDISIEGLIAGRRSGESPQSLKHWLDQRRSEA